MGTAQAVRTRTRALEGTAAERVEARSRTKFAEVLAHFPPLRTTVLDPSSMTLVEAVHLVAFQVATATPTKLRTIPPLGSNPLAYPFSRSWHKDRALYSLLRSGLASISPRTPRQFVRLMDGEPAIDFSGVFWLPSLVLESQVSAIVEAAHRRQWPTQWAQAIVPMAVTMAAEEVHHMINEYATWYGWPRPNNTDDIRDFVGEVVPELSLSIAMRCLSDGAAAALVARDRYTGTVPQRWSNHMVVHALRVLRKHRSSKRRVQPVRRRITRTAVDVALWAQMLYKDDGGYDCPLSEITFPSGRGLR
jgi:hypothetical protein